jgi:predicted protein tyrosine phosphatase
MPAKCAFRFVSLPEGVPGRLALHSMPGAFEPWSDFLVASSEAQISLVVCLAEEREIRVKSPRYAEAIASASLPFERWEIPFPNGGIAEDHARFDTLVTLASASLSEGRRVLVHCAYGVGRTGTFARCVVHSLGVPPEVAAELVSTAGSCPETEAQRDLVTRHGKR